MVGRSVLVVDDNEFVRKALTTILKDKDIPAIEAASEEDGWKAYLANKDHVGLVITDCNMESDPVAGIKLAKKLRAADPKLKIALHTPKLKLSRRMTEFLEVTQEFDSLNIDIIDKCESKMSEKIDELLENAAVSVMPRESGKLQK